MRYLYEKCQNPISLNGTKDIAKVKVFCEANAEVMAIALQTVVSVS
jgi:hypothetical protein